MPISGLARQNFTITQTVIYVMSRFGAGEIGLKIVETCRHHSQNIDIPTNWTNLPMSQNFHRNSLFSHQMMEDKNFQQQISRKQKKLHLMDVVPDSSLLCSTSTN